MSSPVLDKLTQVQEQVLDIVDAAQKPIVEGVRKASEAIDSVLPTLPALPGADQLPTAEEFVANQFDFALKLIEAERRLVDAVIAASRPVTDKLMAVEDEKPATRSSAKKAA